MREIKDGAILGKYLKKYRISELFDTENLPFRLVEYAPGEQINYLHPPEEFLKFVVEGTLCIYSISGEGNRYVYGRIDHPVFLGEMEFCGKRYDNHWHEAMTRLRCVELYVPPLKETLEADNRFLRFLLQVFAAERYRLTMEQSGSETGCRERLLNLLRASPEHSLSGVEAAAERLHCSSRQVLRELKALCEEELIEKIGKGKYRLKS